MTDRYNGLANRWRQMISMAGSNLQAAETFGDLNDFGKEFLIHTAEGLETCAREIREALQEERTERVQVPGQYFAGESQSTELKKAEERSRRAEPCLPTPSDKPEERS